MTDDLGRCQPADPAGMRTAFMNMAGELGVDIAFQEDNIYRRNRRLVAFDMDSTLVQQEIIDELARAAGVGTKVAEITAAAMRGEIDFILRDRAQGRRQLRIYREIDRFGTNYAKILELPGKEEIARGNLEVTAFIQGQVGFDFFECK